MKTIMKKHGFKMVQKKQTKKNGDTKVAPCKWQSAWGAMRHRMLKVGVLTIYFKLFQFYKCFFVK